MKRKKHNYDYIFLYFKFCLKLNTNKKIQKSNLISIKHSYNGYIKFIGKGITFYNSCFILGNSPKTVKHQ